MQVRTAELLTWNDTFADGSWRYLVDVMTMMIMMKEVANDDDDDDW